MAFEPKSFATIVSEMAAKMASETPITDFNPGSVVLTLLETAAQEDFQQYVQMVQLIENFNLDTTSGTDLDDRAAEYGLTRLEALPHSGFITISDLRFNKIASGVYAGLPGPTSSSLTINVDDASSFTSTGSIYIGRGTSNSEGPIAYSIAPVDNGSFWTITLDIALANDHGTDEEVVLAQFGNRVVTAGTEVRIPESDFSQEVIFEINQTQTLLDGESEIENTLATALEPGGFNVPSGSIIQFINSPFTGSAVTNPLSFVNGRDIESDQELRDRIRDTIQSLSRGTGRSIETGIVGLLDETTNSIVVSASIVPPVVLADGPTRVYIDNGRGLEPELAPIGLETVLTSATGGEQFFQVKNFPLVKANVISQIAEPFNLSGTETLIVTIGTNEETFTFIESDFSNPGSAEATEVSEAINNRSTLLEARTILESGLRRILLFGKALENESLTVDAASTAQTALNFATREVFTLKLYKNDLLLTKDGITAAISSQAQPFDLSTSVVTTTDGDLTVTADSRVITKTVPGTTPFLQFIAAGDYVKFSSDSDLFYKKVKTVVSDIKLILDTDYSSTGGGVGDLVIWNSPQLEVAANGDINETEIVSFGPNDFANAAQALASEVFTRVDAEVNLSRVELAVNSTKVKILSELENSADSKIQITGGAASIDLGFSTVSNLSGTATFTGGSTIVTGAGTSFLTDLTEGQWIKIDTDDKGSWTKVETIESDTILYLTEGYRGTDGVGVTLSRINYSDLISGSNKDYTLNKTNGQIELSTPLVVGDNLTAGSINTRAFSDSVTEVYDFDSLGPTSTLIVCVDGGFRATVTTGDAAPPYDTFRSTNLLDFDASFFNGFYLEWISGNNLGETSTVTSYTPATGEVTTVAGFTNPVAIGDIFILCQTIDFTNGTDFADPVNATATEVITAINTQLLGAKAELKTDSSIRLRTNNFEESGKIQVKGGSSNVILGFSLTESSNQETNTAFVVTQNNDREGLTSALGYTLGPEQNLAVILDADPTRTFSIEAKIDETVTTGGVGTFSATGLLPTYNIDSTFNDYCVFWTG
jgi:uncharacterized phage protein gp47/JayE